MCKTIKHTVRFRVPPEPIYDLLADSCRRPESTGRTAVMSDKVGGEFSTDAGQVTGINVDLVPGRRLVQAWRRKDFPRGHLLDGGDHARSDPRRRRRATR